MSITTAEQYFLWLVFYSVAGWAYESLICSIDARRPINRGFLNGPYCPIYGFGAVFDILLLGRIHNPVALFFLGAVVACTLEYITSYVMEKLFHVRWWDYSDKKFNLNGRICMLGAIVFGLFSVVLVLLIHPAVSYCIGQLPAVALHIIVAVSFEALLADCIITIQGICGFHQKLQEFSDSLEQAKNTAAERIRNSQTFVKIDSMYDAFHEKMNHQQKRMLFVFPRLKYMGYNGVISELKKTAFRKKFKKKNKSVKKD